MWGKVVKVGEGVHGKPGKLGLSDVVVRTVLCAGKTHDKGNRVVSLEKGIE